jgi:hypothetical protein
MPSKSRLLILFAPLLASLIAGCPGVDGPGDTLPKPILPPTSEIPAGTYSGMLEVSSTVREDGRPTTDMQTAAFSIVIDQDGRLLDADANPMMINGTYLAEASPYGYTLFAESITVAPHRIVLEGDLTVVADLGDVSGEFTGTETTTVIYHPSTDTIEFIRTQDFGGVDSAGTLVDFDVEAQGNLSRNQ